MITDADLTTIGVDLDGGISEAEYWAIEESFNDANDGAQDDYDYDKDGNDQEFFLKEKWVLYGTTVEGESSVMGYTLTIMSIRNWKKIDVLAGNYIYIADGGADNWA